MASEKAINSATSWIRVSICTPPTQDYLWLLFLAADRLLKLGAVLNMLWSVDTSQELLANKRRHPKANLVNKPQPIFLRATRQLGVIELYEAAQQLHRTFQRFHPLALLVLSKLCCRPLWKEQHDNHRSHHYSRNRNGRV